jgi:hypothetical protein
LQNKWSGHIDPLYLTYPFFCIMTRNFLLKTDVKGYAKDNGKHKHFINENFKLIMHYMKSNTSEANITRIGQ